VNHHASPDFWACYRALPASVQELADKAFVLLKADPRHPSLHFKKVGRFWSAPVGMHHRAVGVKAPDGEAVANPPCGSLRALFDAVAGWIWEPESIEFSWEDEVRVVNFSNVTQSTTDSWQTTNLERSMVLGLTARAGSPLNRQHLRGRQRIRSSPVRNPSNRIRRTTISD